MSYFMGMNRFSGLMKSKLALSVVIFILAFGILYYSVLYSIGRSNDNCDECGKYVRNIAMDIEAGYEIKDYLSLPRGVDEPIFLSDVVGWYINSSKINVGTINMMNLIGKDYNLKSVVIPRGKVATVLINVSCILPANYSYIPYVYVDLIADYDYLSIYPENITFYMANRGYMGALIPSTLKLLSVPGYKVMSINGSKVFRVQFVIPESAPKGYYPIVVFIDYYILLNNTLYWLSGEGIPYILIVN